MTQDEVLSKLASGEITKEDAAKLLAAGPQRGLYCRVSPKGAVSVYGLQRMPVTLYLEQWERLLDFGGDIRKFIEEHQDELKRKER